MYNLPGYHGIVDCRCGIELNFVYCPVTFGRDVVAFGRQSKSGFLIFFCLETGVSNELRGRRTSGRLGLCPHDTEINLNKIWTYFCRKSLSICPLLNLNEWQRRSHCPFFVWLSSCEQNSGQTKSDPFPDITKRFKRYQREVNDRESATAINRQKSPASKQRESAQVRKQTKSCSSARSTTQKRSASAQGGEKEPEQHSDVPVCDGKQSSKSLPATTAGLGGVLK